MPWPYLGSFEQAHQFPYAPNAHRLTTDRPDQGSYFRIVRKIRNRPILDLFNRLIDHKTRHEKPLTGNYRISKAVRDLDIEPRRLKDAVNDVLKFGTIDVEEFVGGHDLDVGHQKCRV